MRLTPSFSAGVYLAKFFETSATVVKNATKERVSDQKYLKNATGLADCQADEACGHGNQKTIRSPDRVGPPQDYDVARDRLHGRNG